MSHHRLHSFIIRFVRLANYRSRRGPSRTDIISGGSLRTRIYAVSRLRFSVDSQRSS